MLGAYEVAVESAEELEAEPSTDLDGREDQERFPPCSQLAKRRGEPKRPPTKDGQCSEGENGFDP